MADGQHLRPVPPDTSRDGPPRPHGRTLIRKVEESDPLIPGQLGSTREQLVQSLSQVFVRSGNWKFRQNLAVELRKSFTECLGVQSVFVLEQLAQDKDARVRSTAACEMLKLVDTLEKRFREGPHAPAVLTTLLELAKDDSPEAVRDHAVARLQKLKDCPSTSVRQASTVGFGKALAAGRNVPAASELLLQSTRDKNYVVRERAAAALGKAVAAIPDAPGALDALRRAASDPDARVRKGADEELKRLSGSLAATLAEDLSAPGAFEILLELGQHPSWHVRDSAIHALGNLLDVAGKVMLKTKEDKDVANRNLGEAVALANSAAGRASEKNAQAAAAANALANATPGKNSAGVDLEKLQEEADALEREAAEATQQRALAKSKEAVERANAEKANNENAVALKVAVSACEAILASVSDSSAKVRLSVGKLMGAAMVRGNAPLAFTNALRTLVADAEGDVRFCAAIALGNAKWLNKNDATAALLELSTDKSWKIRHDVAHALGIDKTGQPAVLSALQKLCKDGINDVRSSAACALKGMKIMALFEEQWQPGTIQRVVEEDPIWRRWLVKLDAEPAAPSRYTVSIKAIPSESAVPAQGGRPISARIGLRAGSAQIRLDRPDRPQSARLHRTDRPRSAR